MASPGVFFASSAPGCIAAALKWIYLYLQNIFGKILTHAEILVLFLLVVAGSVSGRLLFYMPYSTYTTYPTHGTMATVYISQGLCSLGAGYRGDGPSMKISSNGTKASEIHFVLVGPLPSSWQTEYAALNERIRVSIDWWRLSEPFLVAFSYYQPQGEVRNCVPCPF